MTSKSPNVRTPVEKLNKRQTIKHYNAVLLEDIKSKMELVIEGMGATEERLTKKLDDFRDEVNERFEIVESVVKEHSKMLQDHGKMLQDHGKMLQDHGKMLQGHGNQLGELRAEMQQMGKDIRGEMHEMEDRLSDKIDKVGERVGSVEGRLNNHLAEHP